MVQHHRQHLRLYLPLLIKGRPGAPCTDRCDYLYRLRSSFSHFDTWPYPCMASLEKRQMAKDLVSAWRLICEVFRQ